MAWKVIFSARSKTDLEKIVKYIARDNLAAAERFGSRLIEQAESLRMRRKSDQRYLADRAQGSSPSVRISLSIGRTRRGAPLEYCGFGTQRGEGGRCGDCCRQAAGNCRLAACAPQKCDRRTSIFRQIPPLAASFTSDHEWAARSGLGLGSHTRNCAIWM
jgi:plasmid stabilization system protein ParE